MDAGEQTRGFWTRVFHPRLKGWPLLLYAAAVCMVEVLAYVMLCLAMGWDSMDWYIVGGLFCLAIVETWLTITGADSSALKKDDPMRNPFRPWKIALAIGALSVGWFLTESPYLFTPDHRAGYPWGFPIGWTIWTAAAIVILYRRPEGKPPR